MELGQIRTQQLEQGGPDVKARLMRLPGPVPGWRQRPLGGRLLTGGECRLDGLSTLSDFRLVTVISFQGLPECEHVCRAIMACERFCDGRDRRLTPDIAVGGQRGGIVITSHNGADDLHPRGPGDIRHDVMPLHMHQHQRLLPMLHVGRGILQQALAMP